MSNPLHDYFATVCLGLEKWAAEDTKDTLISLAPNPAPTVEYLQGNGLIFFRCSATLSPALLNARLRAIERLFSPLILVDGLPLSSSTPQTHTAHMKSRLNQKKRRKLLKRNQAEACSDDQRKGANDKESFHEREEEPNESMGITRESDQAKTALLHILMHIDEDRWRKGLQLWKLAASCTPFFFSTTTKADEIRNKVTPISSLSSSSSSSQNQRPQDVCFQIQSSDEEENSQKRTFDWGVDPPSDRPDTCSCSCLSAAYSTPLCRISDGYSFLFQPFCPFSPLPDHQMGEGQFAFLSERLALEARDAVIALPDSPVPSIHEFFVQYKDRIATGREDPVPTFRASCDRHGHKSSHLLLSQDLASVVGFYMGVRYRWKVDLVKYDVELYSNVSGNLALVGISLSARTPVVHLRNRMTFGSTSLAPSIAYTISKLARIQAGDVVIDPMCGVGTIPIEASFLMKEAAIWGSDVDRVCVEKFDANSKHAYSSSAEKGVRRVEVVRADIGTYPFRQETTDVIISDLPFGIRSGNHHLNSRVYPRIIKTVQRLLRPGGRAILMTLERKLFLNCLKSSSLVLYDSPAVLSLPPC